MIFKLFYYNLLIIVLKVSVNMNFFIYLFFWIYFSEKKVRNFGL